MPDLILGSSGMLGRALSKKHPAACLHTSSNCNLEDETITSFYFLHKNDLDTVYFAAGRVGGIEDNMAFPVAFLDSNLRMGLNALRFAHRAGARRFVNISSACAFPACQAPVGVQDLWSGRPAETNASYGIAKRVIAEAAAQYRLQHQFNAITIFLPNLYGAAPRRDPARLHVIPAIIERVRRAMENNEDTVTLRGTGEERREFMFVDDAAQAVLEIADWFPSWDLERRATVTAGTGRVWSVAEIAQAVKEALHWAGTFRFDNSLPAGPAARIMQRDFTFKPKFDLQDHIRKMVTEDAQRAEAAEKPRRVHEPVRASQSVAVATP